MTDSVQVVLDSVNTGLGLVNDVGGEAKDLLVDEAEKTLAQDMSRQVFRVLENLGSNKISNR